ncbi:hypothetical protein Rt10032_c03g1564 [Rhodotorula toruloides]|uniref:Uncharacterized protein n=1 Tax=Rhodotorula toruloides TaxID=5286 RepID=A0A511KAY0_RHOTO|nr:hypothetical protein Rt10032_c03g1564 [Rhodotorula toruloides]
MLSSFRTASRALSKTAQAAAVRAPLPASSYSRLISTSSSALSPILSTAATRLTNTAARPQSSLLQREVVQPAARPGFWQSSPSPLSSAVQQQVRGYKMPKCMRRTASPLSRNHGKGKTARRKGMIKAKRRRMRIKKIN